MMMASQVDRYGNQNLSVIGDWERPKAQLIGVRGAPGNTINHTTSYWVPEPFEADASSSTSTWSAGSDTTGREAIGPAARFHEIRFVVSNLGVFDFADPGPGDADPLAASGGERRGGREATGFGLGSDLGPGTGGSDRPGRPTEAGARLIRRGLDPRRSRDGEVATR